MAQVATEQAAWSELGPNPGEQESQKFDVLGMIRRRKWIIFFSLVFSIGLGVLYYIKAPVVYQSSAKVLILDNNPVPAIFSGAGLGQGQDQFLGHDIVISSPLIVETAVKEKKLNQLDSFTGVPHAMVMEAVASGVEVMADRNDPHVFELTFSHSHSQDCRSILQAMVDTYHEHLEEEYKDSGKETLDLIDEAKGELLLEIKAVKAAKYALMKDSPLQSSGSSGEVVNIHRERLMGIEKRRAELEFELTELQSDFAWINNAIESGSNEEAIKFIIEKYRNLRENIYDQNNQAASEGAIIALDSELKELETRLGEDHPRIKTLTAQKQAMVEMFNIRYGSLWFEDESIDLPQIYRLAISEQIHTLTAKINSFNEKYTIEKDLAKKLEVHEIALAEAQDQIDDLQTLYTEIVSKLKDVDLSTDSEGYDYQILQSASLAEQSDPNIIKVMAIACFLGLLSGAGLGYLVDIADKTFRTPTEITQHLQMPLIGHIPVLSLRKKKDAAASVVDVSAVTFHRPKSKSAEAFRAIRTSLFFSTRGQQHQVIQVTSPTPGDGKSTITSNLAISLAQSGKNVLIVDSDLRRPRLHKVFGETSDVGFAQILSGEADPQEAILETEIEGLSFMPCGTRPANPAELLTSPRLADVIDWMRDQYDFVIIDTPPLLAVTDPCAVAARVDGVIMALRIKKNVRLSADRAREILSSINGNVIGVVVNGVGGGASAYGSKYGYGGYTSGYGGYGYGGYGYGGYGYGGYGGYGYNYGYGGNEYYGDKTGKRQQDPPQRPEPTARIEAPHEQQS